MMRFHEYQEWSIDTAVYPRAGSGHQEAVIYAALGLAGEAGEIANKAKKILRDGDSLELRSALRDELGDVLWYLARLSDELSTGLTEVARKNQDKLELRKLAGTIGGSGDHR